MSTLKTNRIENLSTTDGGISINNSGQVGINTSSPGRTLDVSGSIRSGGSTNPYIALNDGTAEAYFEISGSQTRVSSGTSQPLLFRTGSNERMRIDSSGNVGIGTTSPAVSLEVNKPSAQFRINDGTVDVRIEPLAASNVGIFGTESNHGVVFKTNATERMRIDSSGNVGIGSTNPDASLDVRKDGTGQNIQVWRSDLGTNYRNLILESPASDSATEPFTFSTGNSLAVKIDGTERVRVDSSGTTKLFGDLEFSGSRINGTLTSTVSHDSYATITTPAKGGMAVITAFSTYDSFAQPSGSGIIYFDVGNSKLVATIVDAEAIRSGSGTYLGESTNPSTTASDFTNGITTVAAPTSNTNQLRIWNRTGSNRQYKVVFI